MSSSPFSEQNKQTKIQLAEIKDSDCFALTSTFFRTHNDNTAINIGIAVCPIFSPSSASFLWRSCCYIITESSISCLVTSAEVMDTAFPISPASSSCSLVLPSGSPMAAWAFMWMKSDRTKPCFCGYLSHRLLLASSLWLSAERHLVGMSWKCNRSLSVSHLKYVWVRELGGEGGNSRNSCLNLWSYCCFSWRQSKLTCHVESNLAGDSLNNS